MAEIPHHTPRCALSHSRNSLDSKELILLPDHLFVVALYDFPASSDRDLELVKGEKLQVLSK